MSLQMDSRVAFNDSETRHDEMHSTIDEWLDDLPTLTDEAKASQRSRTGSMCSHDSTTTLIATHD